MTPSIVVIDQHNADIVGEGGAVLMAIRNARDWRDAAERTRLGPNGHVWQFDRASETYRVRYVVLTDGVVADIAWSETGEPPAIGAVESLDADVGWLMQDGTLVPPPEEG